ncbi:MAG: succinate dehydrogenase, partial [Phycisphaerales bacterium]|nr:succinate dehydrogenase [Phycisphaerales bacterium]
FSPAALILWAPAGFRLTCYYYRGAYYKGFWADPPACAVGEPRKTYWGERTLPLILQNLHRYFLYVALIFLLILAWDAWSALWFIKPDGSKTLGIGVGTIVLTLNVIFLGAYTLGCHSLRHLVGGYRDTMSDRQRKCYECVSSLNRRHMLFAWISLFWVAFSDLYIYMLSTGAWSDLRIL